MRTFSLFLFVLSLVSFAVSAPAADGVPTLPTEDDFYSPPEGYENAKLGEVLKFRKTPHQLRSVYLPISVKNSWQILLRSSNSHGEPSVIVSTIIEPFNSDPKKLVSYQIAEDAANANCAPSYSIQYGANMDTLVAQLEMLFMQLALNQGWWLVLPDYEGANSTFTAGRIAGHSVLDSIRATLNCANETGLDPDPQIGMWGYSGGSLATGWAAALQPNYAPELKDNLVGAAVGGFVTNITETILAVDNTLYAGLIPNGITGLSNEYPILVDVVKKYMNPKFYSTFLYNGQQCLLTSVIYTVYQTIMKGADPADLWFPAGHAVLDVPEVRDTILNVTLGIDPTEMPEIPLFVYHGLDDGIVPSKNTFRVYDIWKEAGINSMEVSISNTTRHITEFALGCPAAVTFLTKAFAGNTVNGTSFDYRYSNLDYPDVDPDTVAMVYGIIRTILDSNLGPIIPGADDEASSGNFTEALLSARGFEDYDEIVERLLQEDYLKKRAGILPK